LSHAAVSCARSLRTFISSYLLHLELQQKDRLTKTDLGIAKFKTGFAVSAIAKI